MHLTAAQSAELSNSLKKQLAGDVFLERYPCSLYSTDASIYQIQPLAVVVPRGVADVVATLQIAGEHRLPVIPRGGGTSLSGQPIGAGIVIDFSKYMNRIVHLDPHERTAIVEPGVVLDQLNVAAGVHGLQFGPDVATSNRANIGGMIGNNSAGARSIRQGKTVDHVISLEAIIAGGALCQFGPMTESELGTARARTDQPGHIYRELTAIVNEHRQEIVERFPPLLRRVSGYNLDEFVPQCRERITPPQVVADVRRREQSLYGRSPFNLAKLLVGAEGTLGAITQATVHLVPLPAVRGVLVLHFDSLAAAVGSTEAILSCQPSAAELFDGLILRLAERSLEYRHYLDFVVGRPESLMLVEFCGESRAEVEAQAAVLVDRLRGCPGLTHILPAFDPVLYTHVWACRKAALPLLLGIPGKRKPVAFVEDAAVEPRRLPEFVARFGEIMSRHGTEGAVYGHASVGCLHIRPMLDLARLDEQARLEQISLDVCELVLEFHGAMSGEHGDGLARSYLNERLFGPTIYQAFKRVKAAFDPDNLMNPGKVVDGPSPTENLRHRPESSTLPIATTFDFSREGGFRAAAELCNGAGVCRKTLTGTMCPSFMATGEEEHSTRGRANALRLILSGALPPEELTGPSLKRTYDLCLECKGCKAECPSNVDAAKLKMEFLSHYYREHGAPLGVKLMAHAASANRLGSALAPFSNWLSEAPGAGLLREKLLGLDRRRPLPHFVRNHFRKWFRGRRSVTRPAERGIVVLLDDCLTSYCEPHVLRSAVELLERLGYDVVPAGLHCCGRTLASKGFLDEAKTLAAQNLAKLERWVAAGVPIVGCEPSCLLMLVDEYPDLVPGAAANRVATSALLIDSFLVRAGLPLPLRASEAKLLVHGHCHQKALVGMGDSRAALAMLPGAQLEVVDSGCCGMAGSFGYEHYELSMKIGGRVLFPTIEANPAATIVAPGFSCRQQIEHGTGRRAVHPVELLVSQLEPL